MSSWPPGPSQIHQAVAVQRLIAHEPPGDRVQGQPLVYLVQFRFLKLYLALHVVAQHSVCTVQEWDSVQLGTAVCMHSILAARMSVAQAICMLPAFSQSAELANRAAFL